MILNEKDKSDVTLSILRARERRKYFCILQVSWYAGLRVKEVAALKIRHVLDGRGIVKSFMLTPDMTKGKKGRRVFLNDKLRMELLSWIRFHPSPYPDAALFPSYKTGGHYSPNTMCQLLSRLYRQAGIDGAKGHSGRRTFLTKLGDLRVPIHQLKTLAGHKSIVTTALYLETNELTLLKAVNRLK
jgi:integrase/recombinase XerD